MDLKYKIGQLVQSDLEVPHILQAICDLLRKEVRYYHWVGFYFVNGDKRELKLAQFSGSPTEHTIIPFGKGICGQVALSNENFVVQDVTEQENYLSCGMDVRSEIVIPIFKNGRNIGQIDIDSHDNAPFEKKDEDLLEFVCRQVSGLDLEPIIAGAPYGTE